MPKIDWLRAAIIMKRILSITTILFTIFAISIIGGCNNHPPKAAIKPGPIYAKTIQKKTKSTRIHIDVKSQK